MHNEVHNLDSLRKLVRELQLENKQLQEVLKKANISYDSNSVFEEIVTDNVEYDPEQGERIIGEFITEQQANRFIGMFWGRIDVYARRASNGNYYTRCNERWNESICQIQRGDKKNDFTNVDDEWHHEVEALRMICKQNGVEVLVERSRSGK